MSASLSSSSEESQFYARHMEEDWRKEACWTAFSTPA